MGFRIGRGGGGGGGSTSSGKSEVKIYEPGHVPVKGDWQNGAFISNHERLIPIVRELVTAHGAEGDFRPIGDDGYEVLARREPSAARSATTDA